MLVLTRERDECIALIDRRTGEQVARVTVAELRGGKVKLGFEAPEHINVVRTELLDGEREAAHG